MNEHVGFNPPELCERCNERYQYRNGLCFGCWVNGIEAELQQARQTAEFWKAEHLSGNQLIDELRAKVAALESENKRLRYSIAIKNKLLEAALDAWVCA